MFASQLAGQITLAIKYIYFFFSSSKQYPIFTNLEQFGESQKLGPVN